MKSIELNLYSFAELSEKAKQKVLEDFTDINLYPDWYEPISEAFKEQAKKQGFDVDEIFFSGFWSQGSGAMFTYSRIYPNIFEEFINGLHYLTPMRKNWLLSLVETDSKGRHKGHYYHEKSCRHEIEYYIHGDLHYSKKLYKWLELFYQDFEAFLINRYEELCGNLYQDLYSYYQQLTSDEYIIDALEANTYQFTERGDIWQD